MKVGPSQPYFIGICGASASGKTSLLKDLGQGFGDAISIVSQDDYYKEKHLQEKDENGFENFDLPTAIDLDRFVADLFALKQGHEIHLKEYTFNNPAIEPRIKKIAPAKVILVEGIFIFHYEEVAKQLDLSIYIQSSKSLKWERRLKRDQAERGYSADYIQYTHEQHVDPAYKKFIKPYRRNADLIITNNESGYHKGLEVLHHFIEAKIGK